MSFLVSNYNFVGIDIPQSEITDYEAVFFAVKIVHAVGFVLQWTITAYFCTLIKRASKLHVNFKTVVTSAVIFALFLHMSRTATLNLAHTAILKTRELNYLCCALSYIHFICIIGLVVSVFMMGLERSIAVRHVHSYYEEERPLSIVFLLTTAAIAGGGAFCYFCAARYIVYDADPATQTFLAAEKNIPATVFAFSFGFVGCVGGALAQLRQNSNAANRFRSFKGTVSLNVRLLSEEILISSAILRRIAVAYVITCLDGILLSLARWEIFGGIGTDSTLNKLLTELSFFNVDICVVFVMVFFMLKHQYVRTIVRGDLLKFVSLNVADRLVPPGPTFVIPQTSAYFQQMNSAWDVSYKRNDDEKKALDSSEDKKQGMVRVRIIDVIRRY